MTCSCLSLGSGRLLARSACVNIYSTAAAIGLATMAMVTTNVMPGLVIGHVAGRRAAMAGGVVC
jgi:putative Mn2+ efflux pump MntP